MNPATRACEVCHHDVPEGSTRRYCSWECTQAARKLEARRRKESARTLTSPVLGAVAELVACADLLRRGFPVYRAVSPAAPCDLIVLVAPARPLRVEVRTGRRAAPGAPVTWNRSRFQADLYAVVVFGPDGTSEVLYTPSLDAWAPGPDGDVHESVDGVDNPARAGATPSTIGAGGSASRIHTGNTRNPRTMHRVLHNAGGSES